MSSDVIIVTGSRDWTNKQVIYTILDSACPGLVVQGGAKGADAIAKMWAWDTKTPCKEFPANWSIGKRAGIERNTRMLLAYPDAKVLAFPLGGPGTKHCMIEARRLNMSLFVYNEAGLLVASWLSKKQGSLF